MAQFGTSIIQSLAGTDISARAVTASASAARKRQEKPVRRVVDRVDLNVEECLAPDATRSLNRNTDEEARQDHREHPAYTPSRRPLPTPQPRIDVEG